MLSSISVNRLFGETRVETTNVMEISSSGNVVCVDADCIQAKRARLTCSTRRHGCPVVSREMVSPSRARARHVSDWDLDLVRVSVWNPKRRVPLRKCIGVVSDSKYWQVTDSFGESASTASWTIQSGMKTCNDVSSFGERGGMRSGRETEGKEEAYPDTFCPRSRPQCLNAEAEQLRRWPLAPARNNAEDGRGMQCCSFSMRRKQGRARRARLLLWQRAHDVRK